MIRGFSLFLFFIFIVKGGTSCAQSITSDSIDDMKNIKQDLRLSLAQWSFHKALLSGDLSHLEFIDKAAQMGFEGVEYVSTFFKDKVEDRNYLDSMNQRASRHHVQQLLIMVDIEKDLASPVEKERMQAVEDHFVWIDAAHYLGCHSIRVNLFGNGSKEETSISAITSLRQLCAYALPRNIHILVENHGGLSSDGSWLAGIIQETECANCGTLPDFDNFCIKRENNARWGKPCIEKYDRYKGVYELLPRARALSAKSYDFDENGFETTIDYNRMLELVLKSGYSGFIGVEYEGDRLSEVNGIQYTKRLIEKIVNENL